MDGAAGRGGWTDAEVARLGRRGWFVRDGFLGAAAAREAHGACLALARSGALRPAGTQRGEPVVDPDVRGDEIAWLDPVAPGTAPALRALFEAFGALRDAANREAYLGLDHFDVQVARYRGAGDRYVRHLDAFGTSGASSVPGAAANRRLTAIWYANPEWHPAHGGALRIHETDRTAHDVEPLLDRLVVFLAEKIEHEVLPAHAPRHAVTAWYYGRR